MKLFFLRLFLLIVVSFLPSYGWAASRIFWLDSYTLENPWSKTIGQSIAGTIQGRGAQLKAFHLDAKQRQSENIIQSISNQAASAIKAFNPDVVIASDDAASKYVVVPYFENSTIPFVFCGINQSAERYGYPFRNVTGILEIDPIDKLIFILSRFHPIARVGHLAENTTTSRVDSQFYAAQTRAQCRNYLVDTFDQWQRAFQKAQSEVDMLIIGNYSGIKDWDDEKARRFVEQSTTIMTGSILHFATNLAFVSCIKSAEEQGRWAAETAMKIMDGTSPNSIPIAQPRAYKLVLNMKIAGQLEIKFPKSFLVKADHVIQ